MSFNDQAASVTELETIARRVAAHLVQRGETIAVAESSAGGLIAAALLTIPGASSYFLGGAVVYTAIARERLLGIAPEQMAGMRSSSEPYAQLLARTLRERFQASWGLVETGAAGPRGNRYGDAAGHSCLAISGASEKVRTIETGSPNRAANMHAFAVAALTLLEEALQPT